MMPGHRVLLTGVYLTDHVSFAETLSAACARSVDWTVNQQWVALGRRPPSKGMASQTMFEVREKAGKFVLINRLLAAVPAGSYDYLLVIDDDIELPPDFIDRYFGWVERCDLALAQPARTHDSSIDHVIVEQLDGLDCRQTRFVEIGPCFSLRADAAGSILPFDEAAPMGWGLDFVWPLAIARAGLKMGIVDAAPVRHGARRTVSLYDHAQTDQAMRDYLAGRPHLTKDEAFVVVESFSAGDRI
jgi:hypothetical protein